MITIGSLFAGIGGLELGLCWALTEAGIPHHVVWQVEREPFPRSVLARHWPLADRSVEDVCLAGASNLAAVDIICGGFPCQDLSYAGKGAGLEGERSGLWREYRRVVRELQPRIVVVENVGALLARGVDVVLGDLAALGYDAEWRCVRACDVGAPHRRERLFIVAHARSGGREGADDAQGRQPDAGGRGLVADPDGEGRPRAERRSAARGRTRSLDGSGSQGAPPESAVGREPDGLPRWVDRWPVGPGEEQASWEAPRAARGVRNRSARLKALGNAVVPAVAREVGRAMMVPFLRGVR